MLKARSRAGLTQDAVAERMGTTKSAISRIKSAGKHVPSLTMLKRYANALGNEGRVIPDPQHFSMSLFPLPDDAHAL